MISFSGQASLPASAVSGRVVFPLAKQFHDSGHPGVLSQFCSGRSASPGSALLAGPIERVFVHKGTGKSEEKRGKEARASGRAGRGRRSGYQRNWAEGRETGLKSGR